jgi:hypothetical protein
MTTCATSFWAWPPPASAPRSAGSPAPICGSANSGASRRSSGCPTTPSRCSWSTARRRPELSVMRHDVFALLELAALIKDCNAHAQVVAHDAAQQGFGERTEFCVGGPASNRRMAAHLHVPAARHPRQRRPRTGPGPRRVPDRQRALPAGARQGRVRDPRPAHRGQLGGTARCSSSAASARSPTRRRPAISPATTRRLARKHGNNTFVLLLKVVNSQAYGPDVVELVADVTRAAETPLPAPAPRSNTPRLLGSQHISTIVTGT